MPQDPTHTHLLIIPTRITVTQRTLLRLLFAASLLKFLHTTVVLWPNFLFASLIVNAAVPVKTRSTVKRPRYGGQKPYHCGNARGLVFQVVRLSPRKYIGAFLF